MPKKQAKTYKAEVKVLGKLYDAEGKSVLEAISNLKPEGVVKGVSILKVSKGEVSVDKILSTIQTARLFSQSKITREVALKNASMLFNL